MATNISQINGILKDVSYYCGRWYGLDNNLRRGKYLCPIDQEELNALDIFHKFFLVASRDALFSAPLNIAHRLRLLDLGTGTGISAIDMAMRYTQLDVHSIDFNKIQPAMLPRTMRPPQEVDIEDSWDNIDRDWDYIHLRMLYGSIFCWEGLYSKIFSHLKSGSGYMEHVELDYQPLYDCTNVKQTAINEWSELLLRAMDRHGCSMRVHPEKTRSLLEQAGFANITERAIRICYSPWSYDSHENRTSQWFNAGLRRRLLALSCAPLTKVLGMSLAEVENICEGAYRDMCNLTLRAHCKMYIWTAKKPRES